MVLTSPLIEQAIALKTLPVHTLLNACITQTVCRSSNPAAWEAVAMGEHRIEPNYRRRVLRLPDLDHCKLAVLNSLGSPACAAFTSTPSTNSSPGTAPNPDWP